MQNLFEVPRTGFEPAYAGRQASTSLRTLLFLCEFIRLIHFKIMFSKTPARYRFSNTFLFLLLQALY